MEDTEVLHQQQNDFIDDLMLKGWDSWRAVNRLTLERWWRWAAGHQNLLSNPLQGGLGTPSQSLIVMLQAQ